MRNRFWNKIVCFFCGHDEWKDEWYSEYHICVNRKGGKRRGAGVHKYRNKHYKVYCLRCGKVLKKK